MKHKHYVMFTLALIMLLLSVAPVMAKKKKKQYVPPPPAVTVVSRWTPQEQLVSVSGDTRTVNLQMSARASRQFWAMEISCLVNQPNIFEPTGQTMTWAGGWLNGNLGTNHQDITTILALPYYDNSTNRINASITRVGASNSPVGVNGASYTEYLFNLELTLAEGLVGTNVIGITCDKLAFFDRNGVSLGSVTLSNTNNLIVRDGYVISGSVARQGTTNKNDISVVCTHDGTGDAHTIITANNTGNFSFSNDVNTPSNPLRNFGLYDCRFTSFIGGNDNQPLLKGRSWINLQTPDYTLQPITLRTGDTLKIGDGITVADFPLITGNWLSTQTVYTDGDVNGDGQVNGTDLVLTAGNIGLPVVDCDGVSCYQQLDHVVYSIARDFNGTFPNNTLVMGDTVSGDVNVLNSSRTFWPQVSPNGSQIVYYGTSISYFDKKGRYLPSASGAVRSSVSEGLKVGNTINFSGGQLASGKNFAPSWSPSGDQIAYVCTWDDTGDVTRPGYQYNNGDICVINASGGTIQTIIPNGAKSTFTEVFPPAWYNETTLVYAGNTANTICPDQLCYYDMLTNTHGLIDIQYGVNGSSTFANMPVIIRKSSTLSYLFYRRFDNSNNTELRMGPIEYSGGAWSGGVVDSDINTPTQHEQVDSSSNVNYYDVSPMLDVMFYGFGDNLFHNRYFVDGSPFSWTSGDGHIVDGFVGYPTVNLDNTDINWNGFTEDNGTDFHAFRATFDWLP